ncbi:flagellar filament capping protein FliD [Parvibium lacunae]|uniref:Flagellar hook-associated protein 2 n=1 Tax=Parvibium lacunae TaxID=1888893 RepID=A0A368L468_9BURK|nr:flagellar filament capping protein FliD [Parvibium lacunae]RCS58222.1 flagellar hook protein FliD [Parvibium lacunae]
MATISGTSGSSIDVNSLVSQLMQAETQPLVRLQRNQASIQSKISAYGNLRGALSSFQDAARAVSNLNNLQPTKTSVSDSSIASLTANANASIGNYSLEVSKLAQQQKLNSSSFASTTTTVGTGTLTIQLGTYNSGSNTFTNNPDKTAVSVNITNGSLSSIRDAINSANAGVNATLVNDGTGTRLVLTSKDTGAANSIKLSVTDDDGTPTNTSGLSALAYDPTASAGAGKNLTQTQAAQNAEFKLDGIDISKSSNTITDAIENATLQLSKVTTSAISLNINRDSSGITSQLQSFVQAFNSMQTTLKQLSGFNPTTKEAGPLAGDSALRGALNQIRGLLTRQLGSESGTYSSLSQIGIAFQKDGTLALNSSKLNAAITADASSVTKLLANVSTSSDPRVAVVSTASTVSAGSYPVAVTSAATQGKVVGNAAANLTITAGVNDTLTVSVNGTSATITIAPGTYASAASLATEIGSKLNAASALQAVGASVTATAGSGILSLTSTSYGTTSTVSVTGGNGATDAFGATPTSTAGQNVNGTISGSAANGSGQILTSTAGLILRTTSNATGSLGTVTVSRGLGAQIESTLANILGTTGSISSRVEGLNKSVEANNKQQQAMSTRLAQIEQRYRTQYSALDAALTRLTQTSTYLSQQFAALQNSNNG